MSIAGMRGCVRLALLTALTVASCQTSVRAQSPTMDDRFTVLPGIQYSMGVSGPLKGDLYIPKRFGGPFPAVLMIHGGGWRSGDRTQMAKIARDLARKDFVVFAIDYDLVPTRFPVALDQCQEALRFLSEKAQDYHLDAARIAVMGSSAGGELAALLALGAPGQGTQPLRAAVVFNGVLDLQALGDQSGMVTDYHRRPLYSPAGCLSTSFTALSGEIGWALVVLRWTWHRGCRGPVYPG